MKCKINSLDIDSHASFKRSFSKLPNDIKELTLTALEKLLLDPQPKRLRLEKLKGNNKPPIYTIHVTPNHSHKLSFEINGDMAILRRVDTHKVIDRTP